MLIDDIRGTLLPGHTDCIDQQMNLPTMITNMYEKNSLV